MQAAIRWWAPQIGSAELDLVRQVLESNYINEGEVTETFERRLAEMLGSRFAVATTSGTSALFLALAGLGVGPGDEVIVPDVTFIATANAVTLTGARPVLVDVDASTLNIDVESLARAITARTRAVVPVHVSGRAANLRAILALAKQHDLVVVEDAAEALLSRGGDKYLGTLGHAGCFSFSPNKTVTTGQGGLVVTDDEALHRRLRELKDQGRPVRGSGGDDTHESVGFNFKLTNLQAAVGIGQLSYLPARLAAQRRIHERYRSGLADVTGIRLFDLAAGEVPQWTDALCDRRDALVGYLAERGVDTRRFWFPLHTQRPYRQPDSQFPNSTRLCPKAFWLPSAFTLTNDDVDLVCQHIIDFLRTT